MRILFIFNVKGGIRTPRLILRPHRPGDEIILQEAIIESFDILHPWMDWAIRMPTPTQTAAFVQFSYNCWVHQDSKDLPMLIFDNGGKKLLGSSGFLEINWELARFEIGYWLNNEACGKGIMTEAVNALTQFAFKRLKANRVAIVCAAENTKSKAIPERLRFLLEGVQHNTLIKPAFKERGDTLYYAKYNLNDMPELKVAWDL